MSSRRRRREIKAFRASLGTITAAEMEEQGLVPPGYFYFERVDMMEYERSTKTDWWERMNTDEKNQKPNE